MAEATVGMLRVVLSSNSAQFDAGMDKSSGKVDAFSRAGRSAAQSLARLVSDFNGTKVIAEAEKMAAAIKKVEGVSKLTDEQLGRVNRTLDAAIARYRVMGTDVPPHITKLKNEVAALDKASGTAATGGIGKFSGALSMVGKLLPALGVATAVASLVRLGTAAMETADKHVTFADKLGVSTETTQRWAFVAGQTGTTMDAFGNAAFKLGINVSTGTEKVRKAVGDLGLAYVDLKNLKPEQQFDVVVKSLEGVESATERNRIGQALFGKQFSEIASSVASGYTRMKDDATISTDQQIRALEELGDKWERLKGRIAVAITGAMANLASDFTAAAASVDSLTKAEEQEFIVQGKMGLGHQFLIKLQHDRMAAMAETVKLQAHGTKATQGESDAAADYVAKLKEVRAEIAGLSVSQRAQIDAAGKLGQINDELADKMGVSVDAMRIYQAEAKTTATSLKSVDDATAAWNNSLRENEIRIKGETDAFIHALDRVIGKGGADTLKDMTALVESRHTKPIADALLKSVTAHHKYQDDLKVLTESQTMTRVNFEIAQITRWADNERELLDKNATYWAANAQSIDDIAAKRIASILEMDEVSQRVLFANLDTDALKSQKEKWKNIGAQMSSTILGAAMGGGNTLQSLGTLGGQKLGEFAGAQIGKAMTGKIGSILGGMAGPIGAALGSLAGSAIGKLFGGGEGKKVNDLRDGFVSAAGGIHALNVKAQAAGLTLDRLLRAKNVKDYEAAILELNTAFERQNTILSENKAQASGLFDDIMSAGSEGIPAAYRPAIEQLISLGLLTDEQAAKLRGMADSTGPSTAKMESAMGVLKGRLESLGPAFRQAKINETAMTYANAIQTLIDGSGDVGGVLVDAREELGALVEESIKSGTTLPANLKPWIDDLVNSGNLIDANGVKITDVSKLKYGEAMKTEGEKSRDIWTKILDQITALLDKITGPLTRAIDNLPDEHRIRIGLDDPDGLLNRDGINRNPREREGETGFASGTMGRFGKFFGDFGSGMRATLHGVEAVLRPQDAVPFSLATLGSMMPSMPSMPSFAGMGGTTNSTANNLVFVAIPVEAAGDTYRITRAVVDALPSSIEMDEGGLRSGIERVIADYTRTYGRG